MPYYLEAGDYTPDEIGNRGGVKAVHAELIARAMMGAMAFLSDGRCYTLQLDPQKPKEINELTGRHRIQVAFRWWIARPDDANQGETVHPDFLKRDQNIPEGHQIVATLLDGKRF